MRDRELLLKALTLCDGVSENYIKANDVRKVIYEVFPDPARVKLSKEEVLDGLAGRLLAVSNCGDLKCLSRIDRRVTDAIVDVFDRAEKPEHYDGEPCELPVYVMDAKRAEGMRFEYTGGMGTSESRDSWCVDGSDGAISWWDNANFDRLSGTWLLRAIPVAPKWTPKVGDVAKFGPFIGVLTHGADAWYFLIQKDGTTCGGISHTDMMDQPTEAEIAEFYTVESVDVGAGGKKHLARFYQTEDGQLLVVMPDQHEYYFAASHRTFNDAMLHFFGLTPKSHIIMPFSQSKGDYKKPTPKEAAT